MTPFLLQAMALCVVVAEPRQPVFANDLDAYIPEVWAAESLMVLYENLVLAQLIHRDFSSQIASQGDVVNTRRPATFTAKRKVDADSVTDQDATATNIAVVLDQHLYVTFIIKDGEESKGMKVLRDIYLEPAVRALAQAIDEVILGQKYEFLVNDQVGKLGTQPTKSTLIGVGERLDNQLCPQVGRHLIISPATKADLLEIDSFTDAEKVGDDGTAMREGSLGRKFGLNTFMSHNCRTVAATDNVTGAVNLTAGYAVGTTSIVVDGFSAAIEIGTWVTFAGDMTPQCVTSTVGGATPTTIVFTPGLKTAIVNDAVVTSYDAASVDLVAGYAAAYNKDLIIDSATVAPKVGQLVSSDADIATNSKYSAMKTPTTTLLLLNRSLDVAVVNDEALGLGPAGEYSWAFHRNAVTLVSRPLAMPVSGAGALSAVAEHGGVGLRVTITYDGVAQGHRVTVDMLCGVKTLDSNLGCLMLG